MTHSKECQTEHWKTHKPHCNELVNNQSRMDDDGILALTHDRTFGAYYSLFAWHSFRKYSSGVLLVDVSNEFTDFAFSRTEWKKQGKPHRTVKFAWAHTPEDLKEATKKVSFCTT